MDHLYTRIHKFWWATDPSLSLWESVETSSHRHLACKVDSIIVPRLLFNVYSFFFVEGLNVCISLRFFLDCQSIFVFATILSFCILNLHQIWTSFKKLDSFFYFSFNRRSTIFIPYHIWLFFLLHSPYRYSNISLKQICKYKFVPFSPSPCDLSFPRCKILLLNKAPNF